MVLSTAPCPCAAALRQAFNAALRCLVDRGVRNQLLLKYKLPFSFAVELVGPSPAWPILKDLRKQDLLREVLEERVLRVATVCKGSSQLPRASSFNGSFLREIVDEIDAHYSEEDGSSDFNSRRDQGGRQPIHIEYVVKASTAVALQALDAGQAHMTDINMILSHNPFNGITMSSRYSRSDQVMTQSTSAIVKSDTNIASLPALRDSIFSSVDQEGRTVVVDSTWSHQSLARVLPPYTIYEILSEGAPGSHLLDVLMDEEAVAATAEVPPQWLHRGLRHFAIGATYASGAFFLMDRHGTKCPSTYRKKQPNTATKAKQAEDPALSSLRRELTKKSVSISSRQKKYYMNSRPPAWGKWHGSDTSHGLPDNDDSYPGTPGPWSTEPSTPVGETELFDSLRVDAGEPLASGRRYLRTRALHDSYNAALVQLLRNSVLERLVEDLQEINVVPFFDCGGTVPGSVARSFPPSHRIPPDDALMDVLRTGMVLVGMAMGNQASPRSPEVVYAQKAVMEVVAAIGAAYRVPLQTRFIRFPTAQHVLRALHKGLIHLADARVLFEYISPQAHLEFRVRPTCALGASRLWMMTQNKQGMTSLEGLHNALEEELQASEQHVAVVDQQLQSTVASVLPSGVIVDVMAVQEAAEALLSRSISAIFGMATQQRRELRSLLSGERKKPPHADGASESAHEGTMFESVDPRWASPLGTPPGAVSPTTDEKFSDFSESMTDFVDRVATKLTDAAQKDGADAVSSGFISPFPYENDLFQELVKGEGVRAEAVEAPHHPTVPWIEVDTGITAVIHSFLAVSLRPQRGNM